MFVLASTSAPASTEHEAGADINASKTVIIHMFCGATNNQTTGQKALSTYLVLTMNSGALSLRPLVAPLPRLGGSTVDLETPAAAMLDPSPLASWRLLPS